MNGHATCRCGPEPRFSQSCSPQSQRKDAEWQVESGPSDDARRVRLRPGRAQYMQEPVDEHDRAERHDEPSQSRFRDRQHGPENENWCRDTIHDDEARLADWRPDNAGRPTDKSFAAPPFLAEMGKVARWKQQPPPVRPPLSVPHTPD